MNHQLQSLSDAIRAVLDIKDAVREEALRQSRELTRLSATTVRSIHRHEFENAHQGLQQAAQRATELNVLREKHPDIYYAGYVQDALKEYAEACLLNALVQGEHALPTFSELQLEVPAYLNALCEAASECRRHILDLLRRGDTAKAERLLADMDDIYYMLVTFDYPDAITGGLRRSVDALRAVLERTRGDVTITAIQRELEEALQKGSQQP
ncbi:MAG: haloacid dehalogenase [Armatimonadota bacterium]|nr:haloacid dehalogenase [bacterium]MDW8322119.1 haloacid dehalogenase [Armatimonadota bacterium]